MSNLELLEQVAANLLLKAKYGEKLTQAEKDDLKAQLMDLEDLIYELS